MTERPRILVFETTQESPGELFAQCQSDYEIVRVNSITEGLDLLQTEPFHGVIAHPLDLAVWERANSLIHSNYILQLLADGIALVDHDLRIRWANASFEKICGGEVVGRGFYEAIQSPEILGPDYCPFHTGLVGRTVVTLLHRRQSQYLQLIVIPVPDQHGQIRHLLSQVRDITADVQRQQKLDALNQAGKELAALPTDQLAEMSVEERVELLKSNIRRFTHDLLHYSVVEIRVLDKHTGRLDSLFEEGMTPNAATRVLYARAEDNGVTGFVAATGKSYLCPDTASDPLYIEGAKGARSSITVALRVGEEIIGTFNVESPVPNSFGEQDLQFLEIFGREVAQALHTLELLTAEKRSTVTQSVETISREVAMPVDKILTMATTMLDQLLGQAPSMEQQIRQILAAARSIKEIIHKQGENLGSPPPSSTDLDTHPSLTGLRVLVADSDERIRRSAHSLLGRRGCIVETARDGKEVMIMAKLGQYDAILADIRLPDLGGYEVYKGLREAQPNSNVILMTGYGYDPSHSIVKARQDGLQHVLYKPFRVDQLLSVLEELYTSKTGAAAQT